MRLIHRERSVGTGGMKAHKQFVPVVKNKAQQQCSAVSPWAISVALCKSRAKP